VQQPFSLLSLLILTGGFADTTVVRGQQTNGYNIDKIRYQKITKDYKLTYRPVFGILCAKYGA
jgi:hypothetical protein